MQESYKDFATNANIAFTVVFQECKQKAEHNDNQSK